MSTSRTIRVEALTRVEGEGALNVRLSGDQIEAVELNIYEPPRFFEAFLRGRPLEDAPDITARICGICPVAYQMSSVHALERALGVEITPEIRQLRRLLYCGEWIESHALHMHLLHAPDFLGFASGIEMGQHFPEELKRGLKLKKIGNQLLEILGGRSVHPINVCVGGFYRPPKKDALLDLLPSLEWGIAAAADATRWVSEFDFPEFEADYDFVSLTHPDEYPFNEGDMLSSRTGVFPVAEYEKTIQEYQVPHSTALQAEKVATKSSCHFGPLARVNLNREKLQPIAKKLADECHFPTLCQNPFRAIVARGIELTHAFEEAAALVKAYRPVKSVRQSYELRAGEGAAATEAPRGTLFHRYHVDDEGKIVSALISAPTSQNQRQIEVDLESFLPGYLSLDNATIAHHCERLIRSYDPCISCATHFLRLTIERNDVS
ncbi:MAG: Ni/Fe hydrogenase subunit alpha [Planctomycetaceae bacterium]|nr:Ni/Fe hydrogenase subunit alpha [Planctomycetaceae bacterium]